MSLSAAGRQDPRQTQRQTQRPVPRKATDPTTSEDESNKSRRLMKTIGWGAAGLVVGGLSAWMGALYFGYMVSEIVKIAAISSGISSAVAGGTGCYDKGGINRSEFLKATTKATAINAASSVVGYGLFAAAMPMTVTMGQAAWAIAVGACATSVALPVLLACGFGLYSLASACRNKRSNETAAEPPKL